MVVVQTGENKFPLREAVHSQLESLEDLPVLRLEDDVRALEEEVTVDDIVQHESEDLPEPEVFQDDPVASDPPKHESITFPRLMHYGFSPGCSACENGEGEHTASCRDRFDKLIRGGKFTLPKGIAKGLDSWKLEGDQLIRFSPRQTQKAL